MMCSVGSPYLPARLAVLTVAQYHVIRLTQGPGVFAQNSDNRLGSQMDVLSTVLKTVRLEGAMWGGSDAEAPTKLKGREKICRAQ